MSPSKNQIGITCPGHILAMSQAPIKSGILQLLYANSSHGNCQCLEILCIGTRVLYHDSFVHIFRIPTHYNFCLLTWLHRYLLIDQNWLLSFHYIIIVVFSYCRHKTPPAMRTQDQDEHSPSFKLITSIGRRRIPAASSFRLLVGPKERYLWQHSLLLSPWESDNHGFLQMP